jgi:Na+/H+ antiporter NhaD/arsenite permease-like protein
MSEHAVAAAVIFALTYVVLGFGALPPLRMDRTGAALVGATAMVAFGVLTPHEAVAAIDFQTIALLFGMMIVVAHLRIAGFFGWLSGRAFRWAHTPGALLAILVAISGVLSALFVNDTACILLTPIALETAMALSLPPTPYLLAVAMGANAGSVATVVGNPQNMLVGSFSGISYLRFLAALGPVAVAALVTTTLLLRFAFRRQLASGRVAAEVAAHPRPLQVGLMWKSAVVTALLFIALLVGINPGVAALTAASALLITRRIRPARVYVQVDWALLAMFAGLFIVVRGIEVAGLTGYWLARIPDGLRHSAWALAGITTVLSNLVSNVPAVLVLRGWPPAAAHPDLAWLVLAMASTLAGNLTLVGSVANLIVVEQARSQASIGFWEYARIGVPITLVTLALGTLWLVVAGPH